MIERTNRSAEALQFGERGGVRMVSTPPLASDARERRENFVSGSTISARWRLRKPSATSVRFRATFAMNVSFGVRVVPAMYTRRVARSSTNSVWNVVRPRAAHTSVVKKSEAAHSPQVALMNAVHDDGRLRCGLDALPLRDPRDGCPPDSMPELADRGLDPRVAPARVLSRETHDERPYPAHDSRTARRALAVRPLRSDQLPVPAHDRVRRDSRRHAAEKAPSELFPLRCQTAPLIVRQAQT